MANAEKGKKRNYDWSAFLNNDIEDEATQAMVANATKGLLKICAIKSPFYGEKRSQVNQAEK